MFVEVPEPVWKMSTTNWASSFPSLTSCAASRIASARRASSKPSSAFVTAACFLISPSARMNPRENRSSLIGKFSTARAVCAP